MQRCKALGSVPRATFTVAGNDISPRLPALSTKKATAYWVFEPYLRTTSGDTNTLRSVARRPLCTTNWVMSSVGKGTLSSQATSTQTASLLASIKSGITQETPLSRSKTASVITGFSTISITACSGSTRSGPVLSMVTGTSGDSLSELSFQFFTR
ncbi:hypothetical protein D9M69_579440 [compost metagenome]